LVARVGRSVTARGGAVVVVSHDRDRVASMVGRSVEVRDGALW
jgi:ATPase subunit of ABC transporter with duplicated ATPase domains